MPAAANTQRRRRLFLSCAEATSDGHGDGGGGSGEINERAAAVRAGRFGGFIPVNFGVLRLFLSLGSAAVVSDVKTLLTVRLAS